MLLRAYTIYDCKALQYHSPWFAVSDGSAVRSFQDLAQDNQTNVGRHPLDYSLWFCGTYNDNNGQFMPEIPLVHVCDANSLVRHQGVLFEEPTGDDSYERRKADTHPIEMKGNSRG